MARSTELYERHAELYDCEAHSSRWETSGMRVTWTTEHVDPAVGRQRQRSRIETLAGEVLEELHELTLWTPVTWAAAVAASPFAETALYDGAQEGYPAVEPVSEGPMLWHELTREDDQARAAVLDPRAGGA